jgi:hypothetical protein
MRVSSELRVTVSIEPSLTERLTLAATAAGKPLNDYLAECLERALYAVGNAAETVPAQEEPPVPFVPSPEPPETPVIEPETLATPVFGEWIEGQAKHYEAGPPAPEEKPEPPPFKAPPLYPPGLTTRRETTPTGLVDILALAEQIADIRKRALRKGGSHQSIAYANEMRKLMSASRLDHLSKGVIQELANIAKEKEEILAWAMPQADRLDHLTPSGLLSRWTNHKKGIVTRPMGRPKLMPKHQPIVQPPELRKPEPQTASDAVYRSFREVNQLRLSSYDTRVLRRFTEALRKLPGQPKNAASKDIASIIRDIRGGERGDTPFCAQRLAALGVLVGISGSYHLRNEYVSSEYFLANET